MSFPARDQIEEEFRQNAMAEAHEQMLWRDWVRADDHARRTRTIGDLRFARRAYYAFMRSSLSEPERRVLELEDENRSLREETEKLRVETGLRQRSCVPAWREGEGRQTALPPPLPPLRSGEP